MTSRDTASPVLGVIGAECTGKTTVARALCMQSHGIYVGEALRAWVTAHERMPEAADQADILLAQSKSLRTAARDNPHSMIVVDTAPLMTAAYSQVYFDDGTLWNTAIEATAPCTHLVWCQPDFPWVPEPGMRDGPRWQRAVHEVLEMQLSRLSDSWPVIIASGTLTQRLEQVLPALRGTL